MKLLNFSAALVVLFMVTAAPCSTIYVTPDGTGDVPDIKTGILSAAPGDIVLLADGVYTGSMNTEISYGGKAIVIRSESGNPQACIIDCQGGPTNWVRGFCFYRNEGPGSVLEGVTVRNGYMYEGGGIWCWNASPTISNVVLVSNEATASGGGIYCGGVSNSAITNVTVCDNTALDGGGICCAYGASPVVVNSIFAFNSEGSAVSLDAYSAGTIFSCCDIYGNGGGDWGGPIMGQFDNAGNISVDPEFCYGDNPEEPYTICSTSPCAGGGGCGLIGACEVGCWNGVEASVDIKPDVLNPRRQGRWVTCYIELSEGFDPKDIDITTVSLNDSIFAEHSPTSVGDHDEDGIEDRMVKFSGPRVLGSIEGYGPVELVVSGQVAGQSFTGVDTVEVIMRKDKKGHQVVLEELPRKGVLLVSSSDGSGGPVNIEFGVDRPGHVRVAVYDVRGRLVRELVNDVKNLDSYTIEWDGCDRMDSRVSSGIYFVNLETNEYNVTRKATIIR